MRLRVLDLALCGVLSLSTVFAANAQTAPSAGFDFGAKKVTGRTNGVRLDGAAFIKSPQLDARANTISFDFAGQQVTSVRAIGNVNLKINLVPRGGGLPARIETTSASATLDPVNRVLVLTGNVDGFYQLQGGAKNVLRGDKATINYAAAGQFSADVTGGKSGVQLVIPAPEAPVVTTQQIGTVTISGNNLSIDSAQSTATVSGNARAFSSGGATRFNIAAPSFVVSRDAKSGAFTKLSAKGRTLLKINLPASNSVVSTPTSSTGSAPVSSGVGRPTYFEVAADSANIDAIRDARGQTQLGTMTFDGNVAGFYRLQTPDGKNTDNRFTGDKAIVQNSGDTSADGSNFQIEVTGAPVTIQTPFNLGF